MGKATLGLGGRLDQNCGFHGNQKFPLAYGGENAVFTFSQSFLSFGSSLHLQVSKTCEFKFQPNWLIHFNVTHP